METAMKREVVFSGHQPNFLPYMGFFYKMFRSDVFVLDDDVQYSSKAWHNTNFIKVNGEKHRITVPVSYDYGAAINRVKIDYSREWSRKLLETVKDSYDKGFTQSSRSGELISYPSRFLMVGNMNACACGGLGDEDAICSCTAQKLANHWGHVGRQLIERFDIRLPVSTPKDILTRMGNPVQTDASFTEKVSLSAERQKHRYKDIENVDFNGQIHYSTTALSRLTTEIDLFCKMGFGDNLNSRSQISLISLARTIADYDDRPDVSEEDFSNAQELRRYALGDYYWRSLR